MENKYFNKFIILITLYTSRSESLSSEYLDLLTIFSLVARLPNIGNASSLISLIPPVP